MMYDGIDPNISNDISLGQLNFNNFDKPFEMIKYPFDEVIMVSRRNPLTEIGRRSSVSEIAR